MLDSTRSNHGRSCRKPEAANHLVRHGHEIVERNWKTKYCEIDIVSVKGDTVYFTEVKYRKTAWQGGGLAAITPKAQSNEVCSKTLRAASKMSDTNMRLAVMSPRARIQRLRHFSVGLSNITLGGLYNHKI